MKKSLYQTTLQSIRQKTPLSIRQKIGPVVAYTIYIKDIYFRKNRKRPRVLSINETIDLILKDNLSVIRFGDGEITLIDGGGTAFQKHDNTMITQLENILQKNDPKLLICVPGIWEKLDIFESFAYWFNMHHIYRHGHVWKKLLSSTQIYGDTNMTRPYLAYKDKSQSGVIFKKLFSIWEGQDVALIEGVKSRLGVGNDMFNNTKSVTRLLCPPENAFDKYDAIKKEALKIDKNKLVLISLGPTAKVLAYDLYKEGYRVLDIGHIDMEYEMFLRGESKLTKVKYKYFNEINERNPEECTDPKYLSQITTVIS